MSECNSYDEYKAKFYANQKIEGFGFDVTMHVPCMFCAEPDWLIHRVIESDAAYQLGAVCRYCGRGARGILSHDHRGGVTCEFVQTSGNPPPDWLPRIRRVES